MVARRVRAKEPVRRMEGKEKGERRQRKERRDANRVGSAVEHRRAELQKADLTG